MVQIRGGAKLNVIMAETWNLRPWVNVLTLKTFYIFGSSVTERDAVHGRLEQLGLPNSIHPFLTMASAKKYPKNILLKNCYNSY